MRAVREFAGAHAREQIEALLDGPFSVRAVPPRLGERASIRANLIGVQAVDVRLATPDQVDGKVVQPLEVVRRVELGIPREAEPLHVFLDGIDVLDVFLGRIRVVEAQIARTAAFLRDAEIEADRFGVADVKVPVRLGRKTRGDPAVMGAFGEILIDNRANEINRGRGGRRSELVGHNLCLF